MDLVKKLANSNTVNSFIAKHQDPAYHHQSPQQYGGGQPPQQQYHYGYPQHQQYPQLQQQQQYPQPQGQQQYPRPPPPSNHYQQNQQQPQQHGTHLSADYAGMQQPYQHQQQPPPYHHGTTNHYTHSPRPSPSHSPQPYINSTTSPYHLPPPTTQPQLQQPIIAPTTGGPAAPFKTLYPNWQSSKELHLSPFPNGVSNGAPPVYIIKYTSSTSTQPGMEIFSPSPSSQQPIQIGKITHHSFTTDKTTVSLLRSGSSSNTSYYSSKSSHEIKKSFNSLTGICGGQGVQGGGKGKDHTLKWSNEHSHLTLYYTGPGSGARSLDDDFWGGLESVGGGKTDHKGIPIVRMTIDQGGKSSGSGLGALFGALASGGEEGGEGGGEESGGGDVSGLGSMMGSATAGSTDSAKRQGVRVEVLPPSSGVAGAGGQQLIWPGELRDMRQWDEVVFTGLAVLDAKRKEAAEAKVAMKIMSGGLG